MYVQNAFLYDCCVDRYQGTKYVTMYLLVTGLQLYKFVYISMNYINITTGHIYMVILNGCTKAAYEVCLKIVADNIQWKVHTASVYCTCHNFPGKFTLKAFRLASCFVRVHRTTRFSRLPVELSDGLTCRIVSLLAHYI